MDAFIPTDLDEINEAHFFFRNFYTQTNILYNIVKCLYIYEYYKEMCHNNEIHNNNKV